MAVRPFDVKTVTLFGGSGFIGRYVVRLLAKRGWRLCIATRDPEAAGALRTMGAVGQITPIFADIRDEPLVRAAVDGADHVINLVGILAERGRQSFRAIHVEGAGIVARAAREAGVARLVHISAIGADPDSPSAYGRSKAAGEAAVLAGFPEATILRPSVVFGPEDGLFNRFGALARALPVLPLIGGGRTRFQPVYVGDVAAAVQHCLLDPATRGRVYELGGPQVYSLEALMRLVLEVTHRRRPLIPLPWGLARLLGRLLSVLPGPPLTVDQVEQLRADNVVAPEALTLADLGIRPTAAEIILPTYMDRFRPGGRFAQPAGEAPR